MGGARWPDGPAPGSARRPSFQARVADVSLDDLTINVCTIGRVPTLRAAIESVMEHEPSGPRLQLVLNDAGEVRRELATTLARWPGPVEVIELSPRRNIADSHQAALDACTTRLINFMGDDDMCLGPRLEQSVALFNTHPDLTAVGSWAHRIGGPVRNPRRAGKVDLGPASLDEWSRYRADGRLVQFCFPATVYDSEAIRAVGGCDARWGSAFDLAMTARAATLGPALALTDRNFGFRVHAGSASSRRFQENHLRIKYVYACQQTFERGEAEPTFEEFIERWAALPLRERIRDHRAMRSRKFFRDAGSSWLEGHPARAATAAALSFLNSPRAFGAKLRDNRGRRVET